MCGLNNPKDEAVVAEMEVESPHSMRKKSLDWTLFGDFFLTISARAKKNDISKRPGQTSHKSFAIDSGSEVILIV